MSMSVEQRTARIKAAVEAHDPQQSERPRLPWRGGFKLFPVVEIELDAIVLNPRSHRIQAQLESHPSKDIVDADPWSDAAQEIIAQVLRDIPGTNFNDLVTNLDAEGQQQPGVITATGLLVNANRRAVAMRELSVTHIRVAVLPADATSQEIDSLELNLQMQQDFREPYTFTNRLLFVDELIGRQGRTIDQVARALNLAAGSTKQALAKGRAKIEQDTRVLNMIRQIQERSEQQLPLTRFDDQEIAFEELDDRLQDIGPTTATGRDLYEVRLLGLLTDVPYRDLRHLDGDAIDDHVLPLMLDNELLSDMVEHLTAAGAPDSTGYLTGLDLLDDEPDSEPVAAVSAKVAALNDLLARSHGREVVVAPTADGTRPLDRDRIVAAVNESLRLAASQIRDENRHDDKLQAPISRLSEAERKLQFARDAYDRVADNPAFDTVAFLVAIGRLRDRIDDLAAAAGDAAAD
jgi:hypothetical protein